MCALSRTLSKAAPMSAGWRTGFSEARFLGDLPRLDAVSIPSVLMAARSPWPCLGKGPLREHGSDM